MNTSKSIHCSYCKRDLQSSLFQCHITCVDCNFDSCVDCFAAGAVLYPHQTTHSYKISDCLDFPLFTKDWTAREELLLLEGIQRFGAGNAKQISDYMATSTANSSGGAGIGLPKTPKQVEDRYWELYMGVHGYCLPSRTFSVDGVVQNTLDIIKMDNEKTQEQFSSLVCVKDIRSEHLSLIPAWTSGEIPINAVKYNRGDEVYRERVKDSGHAREKTNDIREKNSLRPGGDLVGFMPLREDFDIEYDNDAEVILSDMEFNIDDDHPSERELKLQIIRIYNWKLDERNKRKRFVIDRGLIDLKKQQTFEKKLSKEDREMVSQLKVFARWQHPEEHEALVDGILRAKRLRNQIEQLQQYRRMGIRSIEQVKEYEIERKRREAEHRAKGRRDVSDNSNGQQAENERNGHTTETQSETASQSIKLERNGDTTVNVNRAPGVELLSPLEIEFCSKLPLLPNQYLAVKEAITREIFRNGELTYPGVKRVLQVNEERANQLYDFFVHNFQSSDSKKEFLYVTPRFYLPNTSNHKSQRICDGQDSQDDLFDASKSLEEPSAGNGNEKGTDGKASRPKKRHRNNY